LDGNQIGLLENGEMFRDSLATHGKALAKFTQILTIFAMQAVQ